MKNKKWLTYTLGTLLTLIVLAAVAGISFRIGMTQNASLARPAFVRNFNDMPQEMRKNNQNNGGPQEEQGNPQKNGGQQRPQGNSQYNDWNQMPGNRQGQEIDHGGFRGEMTFFPIIFGLIYLMVLGLLIWVVYKLVKNSGWRLTRSEANPAPAQAVSVEEVKKKASK